MTFQELEWHVIDNFGFDDVENCIPEITRGPGTPCSWQHRASLNGCIKQMYMHIDDKCI